MIVSPDENRPPRRFAAIGGSLIAALGLLGGSAHPVLAQGSSASTPDQDLPGASGEGGAAEYLMNAYGLTTAQAEAHLEHEAWGEAKAEEVGTLRGWAGAWIDHDDGGIVHLQVTDHEAAAAVMQEVLPSWTRVDVVAHDFDELNTLADIAVDHLTRVDPPSSAGSDAATSTFSVEVSIRRNVVRIETVRGSQAHEEAQGLFASDPRVELTTADEVIGVSNDTCPVSACGTYRGGIELRFGSGSSCSAGFTFRHSGLPYGSTTGHCGNRTWYHGSVGFGDSVDALVIDSSSLDYQMIAIHNRAQWKATNTIWRPSDGAFRITEQVSAPTSVLEGVTVCHTGTGIIYYLNDNGETCGEITSVNASTSGWSHMGKTSFRVCSGDSGGPVFTAGTRRAYGLHRGHTGGGTYCSSPTNSQAYFTWINRIENASGYQVALTP